MVYVIPIRPLRTPDVWFVLVNRFIGYSQVISKVNYNTPKITATTTHKGQEYSLPRVIQTSSEGHPNTCLKETGTVSPGVKQPWCEADNSSPGNDEVKKIWIFHPLVHNLSWCCAVVDKRRNYLTSYFATHK
jgi:hypothetical protein